MSKTCICERERERERVKTPSENTKNKKLTAVLAVLFVGVTIFAYRLPTAHADITTGLVSWWKFDDGSGTSAADSAGSNTGTLTNSPTWVVGHTGTGALSFDGTNDYVSVANNASLDGSVMTITAWVKANRASMDNAIKDILDKANTALGANSGWYLVFDDRDATPATNTLTLGYRRTASSLFYSYNNYFDTDNWIFVSITIDDSVSPAAIFYKNGVAISASVASEGSGSHTASSQPLSIGAKSDGTGNYFNGSIDDVHIYSRVLSPSDVTELYNSGFTPTVTTSVPTSVATSTLTLNGSIDLANAASSTVRGFAYGTSATLATTIATTTESGTFGTGSFTANISSLSPNTTYYFRAYSLNATSTGYGTILSTTTLQVSTPTVTTQSVSSVAATTATGNGNITATGNVNPTNRGFVYGVGAPYGATTTESGDFSAGAFTGSLSSLTCENPYHIKAYAENSQGTTYGSDQTFTTADCPVTTRSSSGGTSPERRLLNLVYLAYLAQLQENRPAPVSPSPNLPLAKNLKRGDTNADVKELQKYLNAHGFIVSAAGHGSPGNETNYFGSLTFEALKKFQFAHSKEILTPLGLKNPTGFFGPSTRAYISWNP